MEVKKNEKGIRSHDRSVDDGGVCQQRDGSGPGEARRTGEAWPCSCPAEKPKAEKKEAPKAMKASGTVAGYEAGKMIKVKGKDKETTFDVTGDTKSEG